MPGQRLREARTRRGWTQKELAGDRYTASYISALEKGLTRASIAALDYLGARLGVPTDYFVRDERPAWERMHADLLLASEQWTDAADAYTTLLDRSQPDTERALILRGRAEAYCRLMRANDALADAAAAHPILVAAGRRIDAAYAAYWLAYAHYQLDNIDEARGLAQQLLAEVRAGLSVQADFTVRLLMALANIAGVEGRHRQALAYLEEGRSLADALDDRRRATFLFSLALGYSDTNDHEAALRAGAQALALYQAADAEREVASLRNTLAITHLGLGSLGRARTFAAQAHRDATRLADPRLTAHVLDTEARIAAERRPARRGHRPRHRVRPARPRDRLCLGRGRCPPHPGPRPPVVRQPAGRRVRLRRLRRPAPHPRPARPPARGPPRMVGAPRLPEPPPRSRHAPHRGRQRTDLTRRTAVRTAES